MVYKLTLGLHLITESFDFYKPNYMNICVYVSVCMLQTMCCGQYSLSSRCSYRLISLPQQFSTNQIICALLIDDII